MRSLERRLEALEASAPRDRYDVRDIPDHDLERLLCFHAYLLTERPFTAEEEAEWLALAAKHIEPPADRWTLSEWRAEFGEIRADPALMAEFGALHLERFIPS
ncbi:hypothetical protein [Methylomagnum sp.]